MLVSERTNRPLSFVASLSAELLVVSLLVIIPLAYNDHLPAFHWKNVAVGPPLRHVEPKPIPVPAEGRAASGLSHHRPFIYAQNVSTHERTIGQSPEFIELPPGNMPVISTVGSGPIVSLGDKTVVAEPPKPVPPLTKPPAGPIRVSTGAQMAKLVKSVIPAYPPLARGARISGVVHLIGIISKDGTIRNLQVISGHPLLVRAAVEAVEQWVYKPTLLNNEPVEVICPIDVNFSLSQ
jgi:periplasmic protein TonB